MKDANSYITYWESFSPCRKPGIRGFARFYTLIDSCQDSLLTHGMVEGVETASIMPTAKKSDEDSVIVFTPLFLCIKICIQYFETLKDNQDV